MMPTTWREGGVGGGSGKKGEEGICETLSTW